MRRRPRSLLLWTIAKKSLKILDKRETSDYIKIDIYMTKGKGEEI